MFTEAQKVDIRRYCGYSAYGASASGFVGWRFFVAYGTLEYRLNNLAAEEEAVVLTYLGNLSLLEQAVPNASDNLDSESASAWTHNANEIGDRLRLFDTWRRRLCAFLGVPPGDGLSQGGVGWIV